MTLKMVLNVTQSQGWGTSTPLNQHPLIFRGNKLHSDNLRAHFHLALMI